MERFYRNIMKIGNLKKFQVKVKETDLLIFSEKNIKKEIEKEVIKQRKIIEDYISQHPEFHLSFSPIDVESKEEIINLMSISSKLTKTGPMASVAGAISEIVGKKFLSISPQILIENGGDIFMNLKNEVKISIYAGNSPFSMKIGIKVKGENSIGIATSSGTVGHSFSYGDADAVTVISKSSTFADGAATYFGNLIKGKIDKEIIEKEVDNFPFIEGILIIRKKELFIWGNIELIKFLKKEQHLVGFSL